MSSSSADDADPGPDPDEEPGDDATAGDATADDTTAPRPRLRRLERLRRFDAAHMWISSVAALVALCLSLYNFVLVQRQPDTDVALPRIVRIAQGDEVWFYLQPTLSTRVETTQTEVITQVEPRTRAPGPGTRQPVFYWDESGTFTYDRTNHTLSYAWIADPSPLLVSRDKPQQPLMLFKTTGWKFGSGRYQGRLILHRASGRKPLTEDFCLMLSDDDAKTLRTRGQYTFSSFRDDAPEARAKDCYGR
ncbi:hypothetical protein [Streptomyces avermitilis]|uniref:hypothetical protein n=1 Tax=Streptomyces avermitilis TaxID=33903 RepID=UPI0036A86C09